MFAHPMPDSPFAYFAAAELGGQTLRRLSRGQLIIHTPGDAARAILILISFPVGEVFSVKLIPVALGRSGHS